MLSNISSVVALYRRLCTARFTDQERDLFVLFSVGVGTSAHRALDIVLDVAVNERAKRGWSLAAKEYHALAGDIAGGSELFVEVQQHFFRVPPQRLWKLHKVAEDGVLADPYYLGSRDLKSRTLLFYSIA